MEKVCSRCGVAQPHEAFHRSSSRKDGRQPWCKSCHAEIAKARDRTHDRARAAARYVANRDARVAANREAHLRRKYGILEINYQQLLAMQHGGCAICGGEDVGRRLAVDHEHISGHVRGLLCSRCNRLIGLAGDDASLLANAAEYLVRRKPD